MASTAGGSLLQNACNYYRQSRHYFLNPRIPKEFLPRYHSLPSSALTSLGLRSQGRKMEILIGNWRAFIGGYGGGWISGSACAVEMLWVVLKRTTNEHRFMHMKRRQNVKLWFCLDSGGIAYSIQKYSIWSDGFQKNMKALSAQQSPMVTLMCDTQMNHPSPNAINAHKTAHIHPNTLINSPLAPSPPPSSSPLSASSSPPSASAAPVYSPPSCSSHPPPLPPKSAYHSWSIPLICPRTYQSLLAVRLCFLEIVFGGRGCI
jgi:hypothetical protein